MRRSRIRTAAGGRAFIDGRDAPLITRDQETGLCPRTRLSEPIKGLAAQFAATDSYIPAIHVSHSSDFYKARSVG